MPQPPPAEPAIVTFESPLVVPEVRTTSIPPSVPKSGLLAALERSKALIEKARPRIFTPLVARAHALLGKARGALPPSAVQRIGALADRIVGILPARTRETLRNKPGYVPVFTIAAVVVAVGLLGLLFSAFGHRRNHNDEPARPATASSARRTPSSPGSSTPAPTSAEPCSVAGAARVIAPTAVVSAGVEARPLANAVAIGFAPEDNEAVAVRLDLDTLAASGRASARSAEPVRRASPMLAAKESLAVAVDADAQGDRVRGRRTLPLDPPLQAGALGDDLVWTRPGGPPAGTLWSLDHSLENLDALRAASEVSAQDAMTAIAFRRGNSIWVGVAKGSTSLTPSGALSHIDGLGPSVGAPAVAIDQGVVMIAWADRPSPDVPWGLRIARMKAGDPPGEVVTFAPPPGGPGGHVMSPGLAALPGARFLLVWTEGQTSRQRVRGITLTLAGQAVGKALEISNEDVNSGQAQVAVTNSPGGHGLVAFLAATEDGFQIAATPIACGS